jgi:hypothetical protein
MTLFAVSQLKYVSRNSTPPTHVCVSTPRCLTPDQHAVLFPETRSFRKKPLAGSLACTPCPRACTAPPSPGPCMTRTWCRSSCMPPWTRCGCPPCSHCSLWVGCARSGTDGQCPRSSQHVTWVVLAAPVSASIDVFDKPTYELELSLFLSST